MPKPNFKVAAIRHQEGPSRSRPITSPTVQDATYNPKHPMPEPPSVTARCGAGEDQSASEIADGHEFPRFEDPLRRGRVRAVDDHEWELPVITQDRRDEHELGPVVATDVNDGIRSGRAIDHGFAGLREISGLRHALQGLRQESVAPEVAGLDFLGFETGQFFPAVEFFERDPDLRPRGIPEA